MIPHLRPRANSFYAIFRLRSVLSMAIHEFFQNQGFVYVHTPVITGNDAEGAGETFTVTTREDTNYEEDFFGKHASLTVSGQLHVEAFAMAFRDVYTFGPTFRAENSNTTRHASEFWMIEPEIAFADLEDNMDLIEDMVKYCINYCLENAPEEMKFFEKMIDKDCINRIRKVADSEFKRMTYSEAIELLKKADVKFENNKIEWGMDLQSEHERYLCEKVVNGPVFLIDYPKDIKAFYMRLNDDNKTVAACDLLVPGVGELVGGDFGGGHMLLITGSTHKQCLGGCLCLLCFLLAVYQLGQLKGQNFLCLVNLGILPGVHLVNLLQRQEGEHSDALHHVGIIHIAPVL